MFQYYKPEEKFALAQIAKRIDTLEGANWHGYHGGDILENHRLLAEEAYNNGGRSTVGRVRTAVAYLLSLPQLQKQ